VETKSYAEMTSKLSGLGPVIDVDSHEMIPVYLWAASFGQETIDQIATLMPTMVETFGADVIGPLTAPDTASAAGSDCRPIEPESVWDVKGPTAPGATDMKRRTSVLDCMGINRQLVFPSFALMGMSLAVNDSAPEIFGFEPRSDYDHRAAGREMIRAQNRWAGKISRQSGDRLRMVAMVLGETVDELHEELETALAAGARAVWIPASPPGGVSPAHRSLDSFWERCEQADIPVLLHVGTEFGLISTVWHDDVAEFAWEGQSVEFPIEPYRASILNLSCENFLGAMIMGGVFERHPSLRFGVIECGASWMGPLAEKLDLWANVFKRRLASVLSMKPSEYLNRNVRVTPYYFEPVRMYFERYPQVGSSYCFSTDYPHAEGGKRTMGTFFDGLEDLGDDTLRAFFSSNGELLLP
jgi:predicted TIM-barrel fold metal-dependent hydrolase